MKVLVAYASKYGSTQDIAERIAKQVKAAGHSVTVRAVRAARDLDSFDAFVVGSAVYIDHWLREAAAFVRINHTLLAARPVWLFSSGPLDFLPGGTIADAAPQEIAEFSELIRPRGHQVFFGELDPAKLRGRDRLIRSLPAGRRLLTAGDFRDWPEIDAWAATVGRELSALGV